MSAMKKTIMTVSGIRPDFIRMSSIFKKLDDADWCNHILVHTGQHYDYNMSEQFFEELEIPKPKYNCGISGGTHGENTGRMIEKIEKIEKK